MLTVEFDRLPINSDTLFLDAGSGFGRHAYEAARRGARVVALDYASEEVAITRATFAAMALCGEINGDRLAGVIRGDATNLPFRDSSFGCIVTSEMLEHVPDDVGALSELSRVLRPGGTLAATVPSWFPEKINWMLSDEYHAPFVPGGHLRIYSASELKSKIRAAGLALRGAHRAHGLHSPYWWLRCAVGPARQDHRLVNAYKRFLEWDIVASPRSIRILDKALSPVLGKSYVVYSQKPFVTKVTGN
jgi:SAM-dependent methyltransferase